MLPMSLLDYYTKNGGLFKLFTAEKVGGWVNTYNLNALDIEYFLKYSRSKEANSILYDVSSGLLTIDDVVNIISNNYKDKWEREFLALVTSTYNPIHNYDRKEKHVENIGVDGTSNGTSTVTAKGNSKEVGNNNTKRNAFNQGMVPEAEMGENSTTDTTSENKSVIDNTTTTATKRSLNIETSGNIGTTKTQEMITDEIEMRNSISFIKILFYDLDKILSNGLYMEE